MFALVQVQLVVIPVMAYRGPEVVILCSLTPLGSSTEY